jgi:hypothetical protein
VDRPRKPSTIKRNLEYGPFELSFSPIMQLDRLAGSDRERSFLVNEIKNFDAS